MGCNIHRILKLYIPPYLEKEEIIFQYCYIECTVQRKYTEYSIMKNSTYKLTTYLPSFPDPLPNAKKEIVRLMVLLLCFSVSDMYSILVYQNYLSIIHSYLSSGEQPIRDLCVCELQFKAECLTLF